MAAAINSTGAGKRGYPTQPRVSSLFPYTTLFRSVILPIPMTSRRQFLRGAGALLALPFLESLTRTTAFADRKSTRLNSSHGYNTYAVFCLKKKNETARMNVEEMKIKINGGSNKLNRSRKARVSYTAPRIFTLSLHDALPICHIANSHDFPSSISTRSRRFAGPAVP